MSEQRALARVRLFLRRDRQTDASPATPALKDLREKKQEGLYAAVRQWRNVSARKLVEQSIAN